MEEPYLYHDHKDDQKHKVAIDVTVTVPLLLLVEAHLDGVVELSYPVAHGALFLDEGRQGRLQAGWASLPRCGLCKRLGHGIL